MFLCIWSNGTIRYTRSNRALYNMKCIEKQYTSYYKMEMVFNKITILESHIYKRNPFKWKITKKCIANL